MAVEASVRPPTVTGTPRAVRVSFDRPYSNYGDGGLMASEVYFVRWLERLLSAA
jgi:hypothetical protein